MVKLTGKFLIYLVVFFGFGQYSETLFKYTHQGSLILYVFIVMLLGMTIKPILLLLATPFTLVTAGLMTFIVNGFVLILGDWLVHGVKFHSFWSAVLVSLVLFIFTEAWHQYLNTKKATSDPVH